MMNDNWNITLDKASFLADCIDNYYVIFEVVNSCCVRIIYKSSNLVKIRAVYMTLLQYGHNVRVKQIELRYSESNNLYDFLNLNTNTKI